MAARLSKLSGPTGGKRTRINSHHRAAPPKSAALDARNARSATTTINHYTSTSCRPLRIALLDDDESSRLDIRAAVEAQGGGWVLDIYPIPRSTICTPRFSAPPDVVLMTIRMAGPSGIACARKLKLAFPDLPIVVLTARSGQHEVLQSVIAGACGYLMKPIAPHHLMQALGQAAKGLTTFCVEAQKGLMAYVQGIGATGGSEALSRREREIMLCVTQGHPDKEIAERLGIACGTVHAHLANIYEKLGVHRRDEARRRFMGDIP